MPVSARSMRENGRHSTPEHENY
ncbi:hypothetical protein DDB_G0294160 [Dictyostelium discoideum AX4]|nr:hypothetical protein DDB_G0294160 [Dictyostelium discoideum AX4]EAL60408.1 hypothetical protein DDB_G0294160 [Dictyostelium discoideum AX4]|eukprot:XP_628821.1 hypothetical protein DDB_G0294160 [Dictyostelium discoideum AX4]